MPYSRSKISVPQPLVPVVQLLMTMFDTVEALPDARQLAHFPQ